MNEYRQNSPFLCLFPSKDSRLENIQIKIIWLYPSSLRSEYDTLFINQFDINHNSIYYLSFMKSV